MCECSIAHHLILDIKFLLGNAHKALLKKSKFTLFLTLKKDLETILIQLSSLYSQLVQPHIQ